MAATELKTMIDKLKTHKRLVLGAAALALILGALFTYRTDAAALAGVVIASWLQREKSRQRATARAHQEQRELSEELSKRTEAESTKAHHDSAEEARKWLDRPF